jgi:hypothetical protein
MLVSFFISILSGLLLTFIYLHVVAYLHGKRTLSDENPIVFAEMSNKDFLLSALVIGVIVWVIWLGVGKIWGKVA